MRPNQSHSRRSQARSAVSRAGFTLIEMLVATGLVVLMLMLFAQIFGDTVRIMRKQQSLIQNDQKARNLDTVLRNDLNKMTFRQPSTAGVMGIVPLNANWPVDANQQGFFYYSENDTENGLDDVLHFTIAQTIRVRDKEVASIRGRAQRLGRPFTGSQPLPDDNIPPNGVIDDTDVNGLGIIDADLNQPDYDDGTVGDDLGLSSAAEVVYFVRNGNLYRRVLLLREPQTPIRINTTPPFPVPPATFSSQPGIGVNGTSTLVNAAGSNTVDRKFMRLNGSNVPVYGDYSAALDIYGSTPAGPTSPGVDFWNDFDYSAFNQWNNVSDPSGNPNLDLFPDDQYELVFNGVDSLLNHPGGTEFPIGLPQHRFGHRLALGALPITSRFKPLAGQPMEYLFANEPAGTSIGPLSPTVGYIGRFTHAETSSNNTPTRFGYPGLVPQDGPANAPGVVQPFLANYLAGWDSNGDGIVDVFADGPRSGEDLLISNVEAFDVEVWDDGFQEPDVDGDGVLDAFETTPEAITTFGMLPRPARSLSGIWTDLGHDSTHPIVTASPFESGLGHFRLLNNQNVTYGPRNVGGGNFNRVYDTWHPRADVGAYALNRVQRSCTAPYAIYKIGGPAANVGRGGGPGRGFVGSVWWYNWPMLPGHHIFPGVAEDPNGNGTVETGEMDMTGNPTTDGNNNNALDPPEVGVINGTSRPALHYEDLNHNGTTDDDGDNIPDDVDGDGFADEDVNGDGNVGLNRTDDWSYYYKVVGYTSDLNRNGVWDAGEPDIDGDMQLDRFSGTKQPEWARRPGNVIYDGNVIWKCFDNRVPLQMIRITCRYRDPASGASRQISIVHSFVD
jgi:type II secretory pathway pseudopilin PulG